MKTSLILNATDSNQKKVQKTFTDVNADCHPSKLKQFAQKLNAFTNNTYEGATRIDKTDIDTAEDKGTMSPTFRWRHQVGDTSYETITSAEYDINGTKLSDQKQISVHSSRHKRPSRTWLGRFTATTLSVGLSSCPLIPPPSLSISTSPNQITSTAGHSLTP